MMVLQVGAGLPSTGNQIVGFILTALMIAGGFLLIGLRMTMGGTPLGLYRLTGRGVGPITNLSSAFDDVRWDGKPYDHTDNTEDWTGRSLRQIHVPMLPQAEADMREFYLGVLGMVEMRAPDNASGQDVFWAVSGTRQVRFGPSSGFANISSEPASFVYPNLDAIAAKLAQAGYQTLWDSQLAYVRRLMITDPAGNAITLIGA